ncbi:MAG: restriction endonuclease subunit S [Bacteroidetes bacterium]|nr:restriction endonuclease subunit S [Bacteroidota bacterium]HET6245895.1 restriction endonuclease subunit S [Bacteroidia bacterium]
MQVLLKDIVEIFSGHTVRSRVENDLSGDVCAIQLKDLKNNYTEISGSPHRIKSTGIPQKQFLQKGDILFITKGANNYALVFNKNYTAIALSVFFIIRVVSEKISPEFLAWYINQEKAQGYLHTGKEGTMITNINKATLENMNVDIPSKENQERITEIHNLWQKEIQISNDITNLRQKIIYNALIQISNGKI